MKSEMAHTLKSLTSNLYAPLPLTPRTSQQLLSQLNASFKEQFDRQHLASSLSTQDHTDIHLQSILKNPLFNAKPRTRETSTRKTQYNDQSLGLLQKHTTQALDAFRDRASQGTADLKMAKMCLSTEYQACMTSCAATQRQAMRTSGAGSTILQWLWSSGTEDSGIFLDDPLFVPLLVTFLVAEGQQSRISGWLQRFRCSGKRPFLSISTLDADRIRKELFAVLIRQEIRIGDGLESAIDLFIRTVADLRGAGFDGVIKHISGLATWELVRTISRLPNLSEPQPPIFYAFSKTVRSLSPILFLEANLSVYSQEQPNPQPALTWFQLPEGLQKEQTKHASRRPYIVLLGLRAAELFLKDGRQKEALWIMEFLQTNFKPELGLPESQERCAMRRPRRDQGFFEPHNLMENEERNLRLLDTLTAH